MLAFRKSGLARKALATTSKVSTRIASVRATKPTDSFRHPGAVASISQLYAAPLGRRTYVSESKRDHAQVSVDTAIEADRASFTAQTGEQPENVSVPGTQVNANAMMSPTAGMSPYLS